MDITDVRITPKNLGKLRGFVTITLSNCFVIRGIKIIRGTKRLFLAMPTSRRPDGTHTDIVHPINREARNELERVVLEKYRSIVSGTGEGEPERDGVGSPSRPELEPPGGRTARPLPHDGDERGDQPQAPSG